ncbi:hypothetical protein AB4120_12410 [Cupriavidus sp. 2KB_3]|uniref:hypothetical protein n=1 Tax=Cupriavidus TaxID=106589 RepID=UPI0011ECB709|nr:hypothetical protein [Cupriavidus campinensis]
MERQRTGYPSHCRIIGPAGDGLERLLPDAVSDDPVGIAAALIAIRKPFVVAVVIDARKEADDRPASMAVFTVDGSLLAGRLDSPLGAQALAGVAADCVRQRSPTVIDVMQAGSRFGTLPARGAALKIYVEPILWT